MDDLALEHIVPSEVYYFNCDSDVQSLDDLRDLLFKKDIAFYVHVQATSKYIIVKLYHR